MHQKTQLAANHADGYLRMTDLELHILPLHHLMTARDLSVEAALKGLDIPHSMAGYTEWFVERLGLSVGWDWYASEDAHELRLAPWDVRSNLMLVNRRQDDLGRALSDLHLRTWLQTHPWRTFVAKMLRMDFTQLSEVVAKKGLANNVH